MGNARHGGTLQPALHLPLPRKWKRNHSREHWSYHVCDFPFEVCGGFVGRLTRHLDLRAVVFAPFKPCLFAEAESLERGRSSTGAVTLSGPPLQAVRTSRFPVTNTTAATVTSSVTVAGGPTTAVSDSPVRAYRKCRVRREEGSGLSAPASEIRSVRPWLGYIERRHSA
jgi:hypothetical protein